ncbi:MAG TPA: alkaline phosphatase family protein [Thermoanaerobaculia bacterium]|nr:alkaline phosphatase family protein [Thermoanaerobaculia bacterium]
MTSKIRSLSLALLALMGLALPLAAQQSPKKLIILGFDGADAKLTQKWMDEGKLPNLAKLRAQGSFSPLRPTIPSQTPVSWSTFSTGLNPGRHGVFDFLKRDPQTYKPDFAAAEKGSETFLFGKNNGLVLGLIAGLVVALLFLLLLKLFRLRTGVAAAVALVLGIAAGVGVGIAAGRLLPASRVIAINNQHGDTFWKLLGHAGKRVRVMRIPVTFPPKAFEHGELLSGLGVPDLSARIGKPFYFTSELFFTPKGNGDFSVEVVELVDNKGTIETEIKEVPDEMFHKKEEDYHLKIPMTLTVAPDRKSLRIQTSGNDITLKPGEWSNWAHFTFPFNSLVKVQGIGKFKLEALDPEIKLYLSPLDFDPEHLPMGFDVTTPPSFVKELTQAHGPFKTRGWMIDTWSPTAGTLDEQGFLEDVKQTVDKDKEILDAALAKDDWDVMVHYFEFTDRVQHMMFRYFDPKHPLYNAEGAAKWGGSIEQAYEEMDRIVGDTMKKRPDAALMVVSDHGFASFRRGMNYNTWLAKNGFMTLTGEDAKRKNLEDLFGQGNFFTNVDWSKTKAYALGLGQIYINEAGRESKGIVHPGAEYQQVAQQIKAGLEAYVDPETGEHPVAHVFTRDEAYNGVYDPKLIPDLIPSNSEGYRVGWQDALGGIAKTVVEPNDQIWSGDHCSVYPLIVQGILFSNFKLNTPNGAYMGDVMPTILDLYGVKPTTNLDGKSLLAK